MSIRSKISNAYWAAVKALGPLVPTPQVLAGSLTAAAGELIEAYVPGLDYAAWLSLAAGAAVAYLVGPEPSVPPGALVVRPRRVRPEFPWAPTTTDEDLPPKVGHSDTPPEVPGEWVGPEDDPQTRSLT